MEGSSPPDRTNPAAMAEENPSRPRATHHHTHATRTSFDVELPVRGNHSPARLQPSPLLLWTAIIVRPDGEGMGQIAVLRRTAGEEAGRASLAIPRLASPMLGSSLAVLLTEPSGGTVYHCVDACMVGWQTCRGGVSLTNER